MNAQKINKLVFALRDLSKDGKVRWEETAYQNMFMLQLGEGIIRIGRSQTQPQYELFILNDKADQIYSSKSNQGVLEEIFRMAEEGPGKVEEFVDGMIIELDRIKQAN